MGAREISEFLCHDGASINARYRKSMKARLMTIGGHRRISEVFSDVIAMIAIALSNSCDRRSYDTREAEYLRIAKKYTKEELLEVPKFYAELSLAMEIAPRDVLGDLYMELEISNSNMGQFFTPWSICSVMAKQILSGQEAKSIITQEGFITLQDPACGGGAMVIAFADQLRADGINYQKQLHVTAVDLDITAVHMAYIQLSALYIPATIVCGNSLTLQEYSRWYTIAHVLDGWGFKLRQRMSKGSENVAEISPDSGCGVVANTVLQTSGNVEIKSHQEVL